MDQTFEQKLQQHGQDAQIGLAQQQQIYTYHEHMVTSLSVILEISIIAIVIFILISRAIKSNERIRLNSDALRFSQPVVHNHNNYYGDDKATDENEEDEKES